MNIRKEAGPDGITGRVLRSCADQLAGLFTYIFNESLATSVVPTSFKKSVIIPVPKNSKPSCLNDYHPVALFYSLHCPLSGPDLTYISLLIIPCIIYYVTNKETLTLKGRPWRNTFLILWQPRSSSSPAGAGFFFVEKKDGSLRPC